MYVGAYIKYAGVKAKLIQSFVCNFGLMADMYSNMLAMLSFPRWHLVRLMMW